MINFFYKIIDFVQISKQNISSYGGYEGVVYVFSSWKLKYGSNIQHSTETFSVIHPEIVFFYVKFCYTELLLINLAGKVIFC